jgi:pimeloyl-ACP methyl ester carboxylesterase
MTIQEWWAAGEHVDLEVGGTRRRIFVRRLGSGPAMTLLHGFPSSSYDWARVAPLLAAGHALLMPDFLGFGASEKPRDHTYSIDEQADLVEALWAASGVAHTRLVAHDYAVSVAQELLARRAAGDLAVTLERVDFLNGGVYPDLHRPEPTQVALLDPKQGPQVSAMLSEELLAAVLVPTFAPGHDVAAEATDLWASLARDDGNLALHRLIRYITDRVDNAVRWTTALETTDVPVAFCWGMLDPISGAHMAERLRERLPHAPFVALDDVGHWPPLEAHDRVGDEIVS